MYDRPLMTIAIPLSLLLLSHLSGASEDRGLQIGDFALSFRLKAYNESKLGTLMSKPYLSLHDFCGFGAVNPKRLIILHFYATWCSQCREDIRYFQKLYKKYGEMGLLPISICINNTEFPLIMKDIEDIGITFPVLRDRFSIVARRYLVKELPALFVIDRNGKVIFIEENYNNTPLFLERVIKEIVVKGREATP